MKYPTLETLDLSEKTVFLRVDFNVSLNEDGEIRDDSRILAAIPTIKYITERCSKLVIASHLGRPKGKVDKKFSLLPVAQRLTELIDEEVILPDNCVGMEVNKLVNEHRENTVFLLENLRFHEQEEANEAIFSEKLASLANVYVTDAFGAMHRAHASTVGMVKHFQEKAIGKLVEKEVSSLNQLISEPQKPYVVILGGAKISDKINVIENLMNVADKFIIGGGMAYTFLKAKGYDIGKSLFEETKLSVARRLLERAKVKGIEIILPEDHIIADSFSNDAPTVVMKNGDDWGERMGLDIGPQSIELFSKALEDAKTIFWNGPMGVYEMDNFKNGTLGVAKALAEAKGMTVVGGGDSLSAIMASGYADQITHLSTGGGASLQFLEGKELPGLKAVL